MTYEVGGCQAAGGVLRPICQPGGGVTPPGAGAGAQVPQRFAHEHALQAQAAPQVQRSPSPQRQAV